MQISVAYNNIENKHVGMKPLIILQRVAKSSASHQLLGNHEAPSIMGLSWDEPQYGRCKS